MNSETTKNRKKAKERIKKYVTFGMLMLLVASLCSVLLWYKRIFPHKYRLGEKSIETVLTTKERRVIDERATDEKLENARKDILRKFLEKPSFIRDDSKNTLSIERLSFSIEKLDGIIEREEGLRRSVNNRNRRKEREIILKMNNIDWSKYMGIPKSDWRKIKPLLFSTAKDLLSNGYLGNVHFQSIKNINSLSDLSSKQILLLKQVLADSLVANTKIDLSKFEDFERLELEKIEPVYKNLPAKSVIVKKGEYINYEKYSLLKQLELNGRKNIDVAKMKEAFLFTVLILMFFMIFAKVDRLSMNYRQASFLATILIIASAFVGLFAYNKPAFLPFSGITLMISLFFNTTVGLTVGFLFCGLTLIATAIDPLLLTIPAIASILAASMISRKARNRADLAIGGIYLAASQMLVFTLVALASPYIHISAKNILLHGLAGLVMVFVVSNLMPLFESVFSIINRFRLRELSDPEQELLQKLKQLAPGTYEHTLVVADLAEEAAKKISIDHDLVKVGVLYHDIGKTYKPGIFVENQFDGINPHDKMTSLESARAIIQHVPRGIDIARKYKLPEPILNFIPTHQGTSRTEYFYKKAIELDPSLKDDRAFRYPGPRPDTRETALVMLADSVEACIRSEKTTDKERVKAIIEKMVKIKIDDGQLVDCLLTEKELKDIKESFFKSWENKNHERIRYDD